MKHVIHEFFVAFISWCALYLSAYEEINYMFFVMIFALYCFYRLKGTERIDEVDMLTEVDKQTRTPQQVKKLMKQLPEWLKRQSNNSSKFLSDLVASLWPALRPALNDLLIVTLNTALEGDWGHPIKKILFRKFDLGVDPLHTTRVISEIHDDTFLLDIDIDLRCSKESAVELTVELDGIGNLPISVNNIEVKGKLRVELLEIGGEVPCFKFIGFSFKNEPLIDFSLEAISKRYDLMQLPGVHSLTQKVVRDAVSSIIVWPEKYLYPLTYEEEVMKVGGLDCCKPYGKITIVVRSCTGILAGDSAFATHTLSSDPYIELKQGGIEKKTKTVSNSLNPVWNNETFTFDLLKYDGDIILTVFDHDKGAVNDQLGIYELKPIELESNNASQLVTFDDKVLPVEAELVDKEGNKVENGAELLDGMVVKGATKGQKLKCWRTKVDIDAPLNVPGLPGVKHGRVSLQVTIDRFSKSYREEINKKHVKQKIKEYDDWEKSVADDAKKKSEKTKKRSMHLLKRMKSKMM